MAVVDPYSPCPCGSGQKFKWCCHKVEAVAERAQRLFDGGQIQAAIEALEEGLRKDPHNAWLLTRQAVYLIQKGEPAAAVEPLRRVIQKNPKHTSANFLLTRLVLELEGPVAGATQLQQFLSASDRSAPTELASLVRVVAVALAEAGAFPAALKHAELEESLAGTAAENGQSARLMIENNHSVLPWQKHIYQLAEPSTGLSPASQSRFAEALRWAGEGLWASAAAAFELLSAEVGSAPEADLNLGLCRLWLGDEAAATGALRRYIARCDATTEAVDLEALCQENAPAGPDDVVDQVQWIWPLRDRDALLKTLGDNPEFLEQGSGPIDPEDPDSPDVEHFAWLDRPMIQARRGLTIEQIPRVRAQLLVGQEIAALEGIDDGRLDNLAERFTALAGAAIAPAHPRTKVLNKLPRNITALRVEWLLPAGLDPDEQERLSREQGIHVVRELWPKTPMPFLGGRTPVAAAAAGNAEVPLRAAVMQLEQSGSSLRRDIDFADFRASLRIPAEPEIDPDTVDIERVQLARLGYIPVDRLSDERLVAYYRRAVRTQQIDAAERAARLLIERPSAVALGQIDPIQLYAGLAFYVMVRGEFAEANDWMRRGRQAEEPSSRAANAPSWDMLEIQLRSQSEAPETWVPDLAVIIARYGKDKVRNQTVVTFLLEMGLIRLHRHPDNPDEIMMDPRPLEALMSRYGPRVTTASGRLGVAATRPEIWTPGSPAEGGAIWTPGSGEPTSAETAPTGAAKPKLIIPGR